MEFKITSEVAQEILNYLWTKPFIEVHKLIGELTKLEKIETLPANK